MIPLLIAAGMGLGRATIGAIQANQQRQKNKGLISQAYRQGKTRLDLSQGDARETQSEGLIARGLAGGGGVRDAGAVAAGAVPGAAHELGGQQTNALRREQALSQTELLTQRDNALKENKAAGTAGIIGSLIGGAQTAMTAYSGLSTLGAGGAGAGTAGLNPTTASMGAATQAGTGPGPWGGIDPVDPLRHGAWAAPSASSFNVTGGGMY